MMRHYKGPVGFLLSCLWLVLSWGSMCWAEGLRWENFTSVISMRSGYDDNIVMSTRDPEQDTVHLLNSLLRYHYQTERFNAAIRLRLKQWLYAEENHLNTLDQEFGATFDYQLTPRLSLNLSGTYTKDTTLEEELEVTGYVAKRTDRLYATGSTGISYQWSERTSLELSYSNFRYWYDYPTYSDTVVHQGSTGITHQFKNMRTSALLQALYRRYEYEEAESDDYQILVGLRHLFSESFDIQALGGFYFSRARYPVFIPVPVHIGPFTFWSQVKRNRSTTDTGWRANIWATKRWEKSVARVSFVRDQSTSAYGYTLERTRASFRLDHQFTERLKAAFYGSYYFSESQAVRIRKREWRSFRFRPSVRYQLRQDFSLELGYEYIDSENRIADTEAERNRFFFQFYLAWPK